jgi:hypothetical protein
MVPHPAYLSYDFGPADSTATFTITVSETACSYTTIYRAPEVHDIVWELPYGFGARQQRPPLRRAKGDSHALAVLAWPQPRRSGWRAIGLSRRPSCARRGGRLRRDAKRRRNRQAGKHSKGAGK